MMGILRGEAQLGCYPRRGLRQFSRDPELVLLGAGWREGAPLCPGFLSSDMITSSHECVRYDVIYKEVGRKGTPAPGPPKL